MNLVSELKLMYDDIRSYNGSFGDGVETGSFDPFESARDPNLSEFERQGVYIAVLCYLATAIDNGTYEDAKRSPTARKFRLLLRDHQCDDNLIQRAFDAFFLSENDFLVALNEVYCERIRIQQ